MSDDDANYGCPVSPPASDGVVRAKRRTAKRAERDQATAFGRAVVLATLDTIAAAVVIFFALGIAVKAAAGNHGWHIDVAVVAALAWAAHAIIKPRPL